MRSFESYSALSDTLVIDIGHIDYTNVAPDRKSAVVGAGIRLGRLYLATGFHNTTFIGGICPTVALSGLLGAGGLIQSCALEALASTMSNRSKL